MTQGSSHLPLPMDYPGKFLERGGTIQVSSRQHAEIKHPAHA
jgi:hypothetical protein